MVLIIRIFRRARKGGGLCCSLSCFFEKEIDREYEAPLACKGRKEEWVCGLLSLDLVLVTTGNGKIERPKEGKDLLEEPKRTLSNRF